MSQASRPKLRWVNDGEEPYTKRRASKLRRSRGNKWCLDDRKILREKDYEPVISEKTRDVYLEGALRRRAEA